MPAPTRTRVGLVAALLLTVPLVGACGAGRSSVTAHSRAAVDGAQADAGDLQLRDVYLEHPSGDSWAAGSDVPVSMYLVNRGPADQLVSASAPGFATGVTLTPSTIDIGSSGLLRTTATTVVLTGLTKPLLPGQSVALVLNFQRAGQVTLAVPVATS